LLYQHTTSSLGKKGFNMSREATEADNTTLLRIVEGPETPLTDEVAVDIEEERQHIRERAEVEEFWAGRNLASRISTRRAA
jgi:hypothetical protein